MWGRLTTCTAVGYRRRPAANVAVGRLSIGRSLPSCPTIEHSYAVTVLAHLGGFVFYDQRVVAGLILKGTGDGPRLFAEFGGFEHFRLVQGHLAELVVGHAEVEERRAEHSGLALDQGQGGAQILVGGDVLALFGGYDAGNIVACLLYTSDAADDLLCV